MIEKNYSAGLYYLLPMPFTERPFNPDHDQPIVDHFIDQHIVPPPKFLRWEEILIRRLLDQINFPEQDTHEIESSDQTPQQ